MSFYSFNKDFGTLLGTCNFTFPDINGKEVSLSDFKGKYVYVDLWATWHLAVRVVLHPESIAIQVVGRDIHQKLQYFGHLM